MRSVLSCTFLIIARVALATAACAYAVDRPAEFIPGGDWAGYNKTLDGQRYSPLKQINRDTVGTLTEVCRLEVARKGSFQAGPLIVENTMYVTAEEQTLALDPANCAIRWRSVHRLQQQALVSINRGVAHSNGRLYRGTGDARVLALDATTGAVLWTSVAGDARLGEYIAGAPIVWNGLVYVGTAGSEFGIKGRIMSFDAASGREVWRFSTIPTGDETGADSWKDTDWAKHGGGGTWSSFALDPVTSELFVPVGNPVPDFAPGDRPGSNLFTNSVLVLDASTGALRWWYQLTPNDAMDWDLAAAPVLYRDSSHRDMVAAASKDGYMYVVDRETHDLKFKVPTTTVDAKPASPTPAGVRVCPGPAGGTLWNGPAFDPLRKTLFVAAIDMCAVVASRPGETYATGKMHYGGTWTVPREPATGWITAFDSDTGEVRWKYQTDAPVVGGVTSTAGGILVVGDNSGDLLVLNSDTGELLESVQTKGSVSGGIVTYLIDGEQYLAFTSGNVSRTMFGAVGRPSIVVMKVDAPQHTELSAVSDVERGRAAYQQYCLGCHGTSGDVVPQADLRSVKERMTRDQIIEFIRDPRPPMPRVFPEPMDEQDIGDLKALAEYLTRW